MTSRVLLFSFRSNKGESMPPAARGMQQNDKDSIQIKRGDQMEDNSHLINQLYRDISGLSNEISKNNEKLVRLKSAHQEIASSQEEFMMNKKYVNQPELTSSTWMGKHANEFIQIRQEIEILIVEWATMI